MPDQANAATVYVGLGSNLGNRLGAMQAAVFALEGHAGICVDFADGIASLYETSPIGGPPGQEAFLNSAVRMSTTLGPTPLLGVVMSIEGSLGRTRRQLWEARMIDLDLLLYNDLVIADDCLTLPHPRLHERRFVLEPLAEIAGDLVHPVLKLTIADLAGQCRTEAASQTVIAIAGPGWHRELPASGVAPYGTTCANTEGSA